MQARQCEWLNRRLQIFTLANFVFAPLFTIDKRQTQRCVPGSPPIDQHPLALTGTLSFVFVIKHLTLSQLYCLPVEKEKEMHGQTLRMSLALARNGAVFRRPLHARDAEQRSGRRRTAPVPDPVGLRAGAPSPGKPGGWSRPDFRSVCIPSQGCPAAHPQRSATASVRMMG